MYFPVSIPKSGRKRSAHSRRRFYSEFPLSFYSAAGQARDELLLNQHKYNDDRQGDQSRSGHGLPQSTLKKEENSFSAMGTVRLDIERVRTLASANSFHEDTKA